MALGDVVIPSISGRKIADLIEVRIVLAGAHRRYEIRVDGEIFPWFTSGASMVLDSNGQPELTLTIPAQVIDVEHRVS